MNDSADIKFAADKLNKALKSLEDALGPMVKKMGQLEGVAKDSEAFSEDRARLAAELDAAKAEAQEREAAFKSRETEFNALAGETAQELDRVIGVVRMALSGEM